MNIMHLFNIYIDFKVHYKPKMTQWHMDSVGFCWEKAAVSLITDFIVIYKLLQMLLCVAVDKLHLVWIFIIFKDLIPDFLTFIAHL